MLEVMSKKRPNKNPSYVTVNATLARGLTTRHLREISEAIEEGAIRAEKIKGTGSGLNPTYNYEVKKLQEKYKKVSINEHSIGGKKSAERKYFILFWYSDEKELSIKYESWKRKKKRIFCSGPITLCTITPHFCARVYERLNTNKLKRVEEELAACAYVIFQLYLKDIEFHLIVGGSVWVPTENGLYIIDQRNEELPPTVRTFISEAEFKKNPQYMDYYEECLSKNCLSIKYKRKNSNKTEIKKIPLEIISNA